MKVPKNWHLESKDHQLKGCFKGNFESKDLLKKEELCGNKEKQFSQSRKIELRVNYIFIKKALGKGKPHCSWPPCTNLFRSANFDNANIYFLQN
jgi:hypothetical protein